MLKLNKCVVYFKQNAQHPFAGQNIQQTNYKLNLNNSLQILNIADWPITQTLTEIPVFQLEWLNLSIGMYKVKCKKLLF